MVGNVSGSSACAAGPLQPDRQRNRAARKNAHLIERPHGAGLGQGGRILYLSSPGDAAAADNPLQGGLGKTGKPALQTVERTIHSLGSCLCSRGQKINCPEGVFSRKKRIGPVQKGFHLSRHFVEIDGGGKDQHIGGTHLR